MGLPLHWPDAMPVRPPTFKPFKGAAPQAPAQRTTAERGYDARWNKTSIQFKREHPLCLGCQAVGLVTAVEITDHIVPPKGDKALFWNPANWQPSCKQHHDIVKQRLERLFEQGNASLSDLRLDSEKAKRITVEVLGL